MNFRIAGTFTDSLTNLTGDEQNGLTTNATESDFKRHIVQDLKEGRSI